VSFPYDSVSDPVDASAANLTSYIRQLLNATYATKVNIVAHSLGGIVSRRAIWTWNAAPLVNKLILVGSPTTGATWAPIAKSNWAAIKALPVVAPIIASQLAFSSGGLINTSETIDALLEVAKTSACIIAGNNSTTLDLLPTYPWYARTQTEAGQNALLIPPGFDNPLLPMLNNQGLHPSVRYYAIVATGYHTLWKIWGRNWLLGSVADVLSDKNDLQPGDAVVITDSQLAGGTGWPLGTGPGKLNLARLDGSLRDVGRVLHTQYFSNSTVWKDIEEILWRTQ
jgi:pimeloyl-ACP methyl ester carboxylesterase